ncbi:MAG TPA: hypothetical protein EYG68_00890 [Leucothrix mucor]|nr:hypothetical protein [Leucothrix mucor]
MSENESNIVTAKSAKASAKIFNYGNILSVIFPFPIFILWFGGSMVFYAMFRHHPNKRVGYFTQVAAYQYYALAGLLVPVFTFAPKGITYWLVVWGIYVVILLPLAIMQLIKINREEWEDVTIEQANN